MNTGEIREYVNTLNLNAYDLGGVEISDEDIESIKNDIDNGKSLKDAVDDCLYGIREVLDAGLPDEDEEEEEA